MPLGTLPARATWLAPSGRLFATPRARLALQIAAAIALLASLAVLVSGLAVQRQFVAPDQIPALLRMWGRVAAVGVVVWVASTPLALDLPQPRALTLAVTTAWRRRIFRTLLTFSTTGIVLGLGGLVDDLSSALGAWLWMLGIAGLIVAFVVREVELPSLAPRAFLARQTLWDWLGWGNVLLAFAIRLVWPEDVPAFFNFDEAQTANWAMSVYHHWLVPSQQTPYAVSPFQTGYLAGPIGSYYAYQVVMQVVGETVAGLHFSSAVLGGLTVWACYRLMRDYIRPWAAVAAAFLLSVSHNYLFWSRTGITIIGVGWVAATAFWLILRGMRGQGYLPFILAGLLIGCGPHMYWSSAAIGPILGVYFGALFLKAPRQLVRERWSHLLAMGLAALVTFGPLLTWYVLYPSSATERAGAVMFGMDAGYKQRMYPGLSDGEIAVEQVMRNLWGLAKDGDGTVQFYPIKEPLVDPVTGALLLTGVLGFTLTARRPERLLIAAWLWIPTLLVVFLTDRPPPMTRLLIVVPAFYIVLGFVLDRIGGLAERAGGKTVAAALALPFVLGLAYAGYWNYDRFFVYYPKLIPRDRFTELARVANEAGSTFKSYSLGGIELLFAKEHVYFLARRQVGETIDPMAVPVPEIGHRNAQFIIPPSEPQMLNRVRASYPNGLLRPRDNGQGFVMFLTYQVPAVDFNKAAPAGSPWLQPDLVFGRSGHRWGEMSYAHGLAVDAEGRIYVGDSGNGRIVAHDPSGQPVRMIGRKGDGHGEFSTVSQVAAAGDAVYGLDPVSHRIQRFNRDGRWLGEIGLERQSGPVGLAVEPGRTLLVADAASSRLLRYDEDGRLVAAVGAAGTGPGQFRQLSALAVAADGTVYAAEVSGRVQRFDSSLKYLGEWSAAPSRPVRELQLAVADADGGAVYVAALEDGQVRRFTPDGREELRIGKTRDGLMRIGQPNGLATDAAGNVYVLNGGAPFIYRFDVPKRPR